MSPSESDKKKVIAYYDQEAAEYNRLYTAPATAQEFYPANAVRLELVVERLREHNASTVLDVGCGSGQPLLRFLAEGHDAMGFDFSPKMVASAQDALRVAGHDPERAFLGDIEKRSTLPSGFRVYCGSTPPLPHRCRQTSD